MSRSLRQSDCWAFCRAILPDVSRSFALIIPRCPPPINRALCVAYLLCRLADTVEDEPSLIDGQRQTLYDALLQAVHTPTDAGWAAAFQRAWPKPPADACGELVAGAPLVLAAYATLPPDLGRHIQTCVDDMVAGMRAMSPVETRNNITFMCRDLADLDRYCHIVAGTVGLMSTALFETRFDPAVFTGTPAWREQGRRLGLGLQMTNIIKDSCADADRGTSFIPAPYTDPAAASHQLSPAGRAGLIRHALGHLDQGLAYVRAVPLTEKGIRTFLLGSLLPAVATLEVAADGTNPRPKINRAKMGEIFSYVDHHGDDHQALTAWYDQHRRRTLARLSA